MSWFQAFAFSNATCTATGWEERHLLRRHDVHARQEVGHGGAV
jgi:hypothetical protein